MEPEELQTEPQFEPIPYPNIVGAFALLVIFFVLFLAVTAGVQKLAGNYLHTSTIFLIVYVICFGVTTLWGYHKAARVYLNKRIFRFDSIPIRIFPLLFLLTLVSIFLIEPIIERIPMPEEMGEELMRALTDKHPATFITLVIAAPIMEELLFRGIILNGFLRRYSPGASIFASSVLFGLAHFNPWQFVTGFVLGMIIGWLYYRTNSLVPGIFVHFVANTTGWVSPFFMDVEDPTMDSTREMMGNDVLYYGLVAAAVVGLVLLLRVAGRMLGKNHDVSNMPDTNVSS